MSFENGIVIEYTPKFSHFIRYYLEPFHERSVKINARLIFWPMKFYSSSDYYLSERKVYEKIFIGLVILNFVVIVSILWFLSIWLVVMLFSWIGMNMWCSIINEHRHIESYVQMKIPMRLKCLPGARYRFECKKNGTLRMKMMNGERMKKQFGENNRNEG